MAQDASGGPRSRRLILHLGVQKTGSTAIQRHLNRNAAALADRLVVRTPVEGSPMRPLGRAAVAFSLSPGPAKEAALAAAFAEVLAGVPTGTQPVLISHENLAGAMPGNGGEVGLFPQLPQIAAVLRRGAPGFDVEIVIYTRQMKQWRPSVWAQAVRTDGYRGTLATFEAETTDLPGWGDLMRRLNAEMGADRVTRLRLEDETQPDRPGRQLLHLAGLDEASIDALAPLDGQSMTRLNDGATEFLRRLNGVDLNTPARLKVVDLVAHAQHLFTDDTASAGTS